MVEVGAGEADRADDPSSGLRITVLGGVGATRDGRSLNLAPAVRQTLALLVVAGEKGTTKDWLAEELWSGQPDPGWRENIRVRISRLRHALGLPAGTRRTNHYLLDIDPTIVDAWHLLDLDQSSSEWDPAMAPYLHGVSAFSDVHHSPAIASTVQAIEVAQHSAIVKLARHCAPAPFHLLVSLARHLDQAPGNDVLCAAVAHIHLEAGRTEDALAMVERCHALRSADGWPPSPQLEALRSRASDSPMPTGAVVGARAGATTPGPTTANESGRVASGLPGEPVAPAARPPSPVKPQRFRSAHFVGRVDALAQLEAVLDPDLRPVVVLQGRAACGKTAVLGELIQRAIDADAYVIRVAGIIGDGPGLGPFSSTIPAVRAMLADTRALPADPVTRNGVIAARLLAMLESYAEDRRIVLVVDDAHWLDSVSCDIVKYLAQAAGDGALGLVLATRPGETGDRWVDLDQALDRLTAVVSRIELQPLTGGEMRLLVDRRRPDTALPVRAQLARWLHTASGGLPGVANAMLDSGRSYRANPEVSEVYDRLLAPLDNDTRIVGVAAAILGSPFRASDVAALLKQTDDRLEEPLEELKRRALVTELDDGWFEVAHQLIADAFLRSAAPSRRARLHHGASLRSASIHDLARHRLAAGSLVDPAECRASLLASARRHLDDGAFWESVAAFRAAIEISGAPLDAEALVHYSTALSLAGERARATMMRQRAYDAAVEASRWDLAHDASVASLPATEAEDGEDDRLQQLLGISPGQLDERRQLSQALHLARLAALSGDLAIASRWADRAMDLAATDEDRAQAALGRRFVASTMVAPAERLSRLRTATAGLTPSPEAHCRLVQFTVIDHFESGNLDGARQALDELEALTGESDEPFRRWHYLIQRSLLHETDGQWALADAAADAALAHGHRHGIAPASIARLSQNYFRLRFTGDLALLGPAVDRMPEPDGRSNLYTSARATILDAAGRHDEAADECRRIAQRAVERPSSAGLGCLAILVPLLARYASPGMRASTRALLAPYEHSAFIVGSGLGNLGMMEYLMEQLDRPSERVAIRALRSAIRRADQFAMRCWSVRYRIDLAALTGSRGPLDEADSWAGDTALANLVARARTGG